MSYKRKIIDNIRDLFKNTIAESLLYRLSKGKDPQSLAVKMLPPHYLYKKGSYRKVQRNGFNFMLDLSDLVDWYLYFSLKEDAHEKLYALCTSKFVILDVGTNNGAVLLQLSNRATEGFVYGFEPDAFNYKRCMRNIALNHQTNLEVFNIGLGNSKGDGVITVIDDNNYGMNKINENSTEGQRVSIMPLDEFVANKNLKNVNLIKIDTEGFEFKVLQGARDTLKKFKPILFIELDDDNLREQGSTAKMLIAYLIGLGYTIKRADKEGIVDYNSEFTNCHFDIIAS